MTRSSHQFLTLRHTNSGHRELELSGSLTKDNDLKQDIVLTFILKIDYLDKTQTFKYTHICIIRSSTLMIISFIL